MKKTLLAGLLAFAFSTTASATIIPISASLTDVDLTANIAFGAAIGNTTPIYLEFTSAYDIDVSSYFSGTLPTSATPLSYSIYFDEDAAAGSGQIGGALTSGQILSGESFTYNFAAQENYILKYSADPSATALVTVSAVPEASTYALMGFGFLGLAALRRRQKHA